MCSPARLAANQANATRSTGPRTTEGKARSRANAYKHGLTGNGVALPAIDLEEIARRQAGFQADLRPTSDLGESLVRQLALLSVRLERAFEQEDAAIHKNVRHALADFDQARHLEVAELIETIADRPSVHVWKLLRTPEGIEAMSETFLDLRADLKPGPTTRWTARHTELTLNLSGKRITDIPISRITELGQAILGDFSLLGADEAAGLDNPSRQAWARDRMLEWIDEELQALHIVFENLDLEVFERDREQAGTRALFDPGKEATRARLYEASAQRAFHRALRDFQRIEAEVSTATEPPPQPNPTKPPLGSFSQMAPLVEPPAKPARSAEKSASEPESDPEGIRGWTNVVGPISLESISPGRPIGESSELAPVLMTGGSRWSHPGS